MSNIDSKIQAGAYNNTLPYPEALSKPRLPVNATAAQAREYAYKLEAYEGDRASHRERINAYSTEARRLADKFREDLEAEYGMKGHPKADVLFNKAWERGHSSGYGEVANYYDDLYELVA